LGAYLVAILLQTSTTPRWWQQSINVLLEKWQGFKQVDKLCIIHLFKADFNANNKWIHKLNLNSYWLRNNMEAHKQRLAIVQFLNKQL